MSQILTDALRTVGEASAVAFIAKATGILLIAFAALAFTARSRAATRHAILLCSFAALLALPAVLWLSPGITVSVPAQSQTRAVMARNSAPASPKAATADVALASATPIEVSNGAATRTPFITGEQIVALVVVLWIMGALLTIAPFALGLYRMRRLRQASLPWTGDRTLAATLARNAGVERPVALLVHEDVETPLMSGTLSPAVLLPANAATWSSNELQRALTHELEHVRRGDWLLHVVARGVCALYWFHPLVWVAWRRLTVEAERACDDAVLQNADQSEYAEQLVSLARRISSSSPQPLIAMAARSDLSTRISAVLDSTQARGRLRSLPAIAAVIGTAVVTTAMTPIHVVSASVTASAMTPVRFDSTAVAVAPKTPVRVAAAPAMKTPTGPLRVDSANAVANAATPVPVDSAVAASPRFTTTFDCRSSLLRAVQRGNIESLSAQIAQGAEVNCVEEGDGTPLIIAARRGHKEAVQLLLANGADPNLASSGDGNPIIMAAQKGHLEVVQLLLDHRADPNIGVRGDGNALIAAAGGGHVEIAQLLLDRGARLEDVVEGDENPLIHASEFGQLSMARFLLGRGANVNARVWVPAMDSRSVGEWRSPLSMARRGGHEAVVSLLLSAGARQ